MFAGGAVTIDWEDFGQLYWYYDGQTIEAPRSDIERQTERVLALLDEEGVRATFFALGMLARFRPDLLRRVHDAGHEIGIHGNLHVRLTELAPEQVRADIHDAVALVSDTIGAPVHGYRAPVFSIRGENLHVLDALAAEGIEYDSSIFPVALRRYGIAGFDAHPAIYELPSGADIVELPLTTVQVLGRALPVAGGSWVRVTPTRALVAARRRCLDDERPFVLYMHPYEFDDEPLDIGSTYPVGSQPPRARRLLLNLRWNLLRTSIPRKVRALVRGVPFVTCKELADDVRRSQRPRLLEPALRLS